MTASWFINFESPAQPRMRLFCFPFAGGSAAVFRSFTAGLPPEIEVWAANLPGHGSRLGEAPLVDLRAAARLLAQALTPLSHGCPFAFFGHSLGALLAFEVARVLRWQGQRLPTHLYVSATIAPHLPRIDRQWHTLPDAELVAEMGKYNGLPAELLAEPELLALFLPGLRADLTMIETDVYVPERPFAFPITAFGGAADPLVSQDELTAWREQTRGKFQMTLFEGDHFFLDAAQPAILAAVTQSGIKGRVE